MPGVQTEKLEQQSQAIALLFLEPEKCVRQLDLHFELYAQPTKRIGKIKAAPTSLPGYDLPGPIMRQLHQELSPLVRDQEKEGLLLIDLLWARATREHRALAAHLLASLPQSSFRRVSARIQKWSLENREQQLITTLANDACRRMRLEDPAKLLALCGRLLKKKDLRVRATGLLAMKFILEENASDNLPALLNLLIPLAQNPGKNIRPYLMQVFKALIALSPAEALYFFQQRLSENTSTGTRWLASHAMKYLPAQEQRMLQEALDA